MVLIKKRCCLSQNAVVRLIFISGSGAGQSIFLFCISKYHYMDLHQPNDFLFSPKYRVWRHMLFWALQGLLIAFAWTGVNTFLLRLLFQLMWLPVIMLYCYPFIYWVLPKFLLKGSYMQFGVLVLLWILGGWFVNYY